MEKLREVITIKQVWHEVEAPHDVIRSPHDAVEVIQHFIANEAREVAFALMLSTKNEINAVYKVSIGIVRASLLNPREVYQAALLCNASAVIIGHNHPSGDITPSKEDIEVTKKIYEAGELMCIPLFDHIIVGDRGNSRYLSLKESGYFDTFK
ncbi:JAB domain-containing protein [Bacillus atrophaeus]|uniref:JAB domain-containing protein n=1 Tax=Bacillus atrophaeus TaxID=1452 RepID=UPI002282453B|nr:JAB domain-containing protein [Bacillus atrophaeus]MCY8478071.1 JAB domain-containing protein [Bacillus atrophaeus]